MDRELTENENELLSFFKSILEEFHNNKKYDSLSSRDLFKSAWSVVEDEFEIIESDLEKDFNLELEKLCKK